MSEQFISCKLMGGLGNQLFQVAATLGYAYENSSKPIFEKIKESPSVMKPRPTYWNTFFHNLTTVNKEDVENFTPFHEAAFSYSPLPTFKTNTVLEGYFQSEKYFKEYKHDILTQLSLDPTRIQSIKNKYADILKIPDKLAIHIRRGDYLKLSKYHCVLSKTNYYEKAIKEFPDIKDIAVFSDDINWCKANIKSYYALLQKSLFLG